MKTAAFLCAGLALALVLGLVAAPASNAADDEMELVRKQCSAFVEAWNRHDAKAMASVFADDGDVVDAEGSHTGRAAIQKSFAAAHGENGAMSHSTLKVLDEPVRFVTESVAVSDATARIRGAVTPDGDVMEVILHVTNVWRKTSGTWSIVASRPFVRSVSPMDMDEEDEEDEEMDDDDGE